jgi:hypothetical protein
MSDPESKIAKAGVTDVFDKMAPDLDRQLREAALNQRREDDATGYNPYDIGFGNGDSANMKEALGHWAEADVYTYNPNRFSDSALERKIGDSDPEHLDQRLAASRIQSHWMVNSQSDFNTLGERLLPEDTPVDLSNPDARLRTLDNFTQNMAGNQNAESQCVASSLIGAAVLGGEKEGNEGILKLMDAMNANAKANAEAGGGEAPAESETMKALRERMAKGEPVTQGDLHQLQQDLYSQLKQDQLRTQDPNAGGDATVGGINPTTLKKFMAQAPDFAGMMEEKELKVIGIHASGENNSRHAVLQIGMGDGGNPAIFDPQFRDEGQIVTSDVDTMDYQLAKANDMH